MIADHDRSLADERGDARDPDGERFGRARLDEIDQRA
jgi:hypothetical protein